MTHAPNPASSAPETAPEEAIGLGGLRRSRRQFERYTQISLDFLLVMFGSLLLLEVWVGSDPWGVDDGLLTVGAVLLTGVALTMAHRLPYGRRPAWGWVLVLLVPAVLVTVGLITSPSPNELHERGAGIYFSSLVTLVIVFTVLSLFVPWKRLMPYAIAMPLAVAGLVAATGVPLLGSGVVAVYGLFAALLGLVTGSTTDWMLGIIRSLDEARGIYARLAVAEERLRFSRDLHDVYGRTLSTIAIKAELAAELAARGDERGITEMRSVRALAQESLGQVRAIVTGYREIALENEIAGAGATLRSAGARFEVSGLDRAEALLAPQQRTALAWVVREAATNVIRHSGATVVTLRAEQRPEQLIVTITNDGVTTVDDQDDQSEKADQAGTGLRGLSERVAAAGGSVTTSSEGETFTLTVELPVTSEA